MQPDAQRPGVSHGRARGRGWWMFVGGLLGGVLGAAALCFIFPPEDVWARYGQSNDLNDFGLIAIYPLLYVGRCAMYGLMPGIFVGAISGLLVSLRVAARAHRT
jgi:hypothetical protein